MIGSFMYTPIASGSGGLAAVMWVQVVLCMVGVGVSYALLPRTVVSGAQKLSARGGDDEEEAGAAVSAQPLLKA